MDERLLYVPLLTPYPPCCRRFERSTIACISIAGNIEDGELSGLTAQQSKIISLLKQKEKVAIKELEKLLGLRQHARQFHN